MCEQSALLAGKWYSSPGLTQGRPEHIREGLHRLWQPTEPEDLPEQL
jgi:hypothetical protein